MSFQNKCHPLDKRGACELGNRAERQVACHFLDKGRRVTPATKEQDTMEFIDLFVSGKNDMDIPIQCKSRGRTPLDRICVETKGTTHKGWLRQSKAHAVFFVDDDYIHLVKISELKDLVQNTMNMSIASTTNITEAFNNKMRYRREGTYGNYSEMVFVPMRELILLNSYRKLTISKDNF